MATHTFVVDIAAPRERVFDLWVNLDRLGEWVEGLRDVIEVSGPTDQAGTTYVTRFGSWSKSLTTVIAAQRPLHITTKFGTWLLRGENEATFEEISGGAGTRLTQVFRTQGAVPAISSWIFSHGSYKGSFRGELDQFKRICERAATASD